MLDATHLALFAGQAANDRVAAEVADAGFVGLRISHGYLFQHLVDGPRTVGEIARRQGVSQQAVSKVVAELRRLGYLEDVPGADRRARPVGLSARGRGAVEASRVARAAVEAELRAALGERRHRALTRDLAVVLEVLGGAEAVRDRRVPEPGDQPTGASRTRVR